MSKIILTQMGNANVYVEVSDDAPAKIEAEDGAPKGIRRTGIDIGEKIRRTAKETIRGVAEEIFTEAESLAENMRPQRMEVELELGISGETGFFLAKGDGKATLKLKMIWENKQDGKKI